MRHLGSFLLTLVFAPAIFLLTGSGLSAFRSTVEIGAQHRPVGALAALSAFVLAGVLYGVLTIARISPLGPMLAGLAGLGMGAWVLIDTASYDAQFAMLDIHMGGEVGRNGLVFLLAPPLVATAFSGRRWRRFREDEPQPPQPVKAPRPVPAPVPAYRPPASQDPTRVLPAQPSDETRTQSLPDVAAPSLHYPKSVSPVAVAPTSPKAAKAAPAPAATTPPAAAPLAEAAAEVPPLPRRNPQPEGKPAIAAAADPPATGTGDGEELTVFLGGADEPETFQLEPDDPDATARL